MAEMKNSQVTEDYELKHAEDIGMQLLLKLPHRGHILPDKVHIF